MPSVAPGDQGAALLALYDDAVGEVFGYLLARCRNRTVAEDVTSDVFMGAVDSVATGHVETVTTAWLIGIARHKLVDHWRRQERDDRAVEAAEPPAALDDWDVQLDALLAHETLAALGGHHRSALALRYLDGLPVREVAACLGRTEGATEVLLVRAKAAFRKQYEHHRPDTAGAGDR